MLLRSWQREVISMFAVAWSAVSAAGRPGRVAAEAA